MHFGEIKCHEVNKQRLLESSNNRGTLVIVRHPVRSKYCWGRIPRSIVINILATGSTTTEIC